MRTLTKAAALVAMLAISSVAFAAQATTAKKAAASKPAKAAAVSTHTTAGTVKSSSASSLVISKGGKDQTFVLNASTETKGALDTGAHVTVHYTLDGKNMVATAITVQPVKAAKGKGK